MYERERGWFTTPTFSEPEVFDFPEVGPVECVNVEHEEVLLVPRWVDAGRVTFKYGLGDEFIRILKTIELLGLDSKELVDVKDVKVAPRDVAIPVAQPGDYHLRARLSGAGGMPATAELLPIAGGEPLKSFTLVPAVETGWVSAGSTHLDPGAYAAQFLLPPGATLSKIEMAPPCVIAIEPPNGWQATGVTTSDDLAVTALKAIDVEYELPPDATPIELSGDAFQVEAPYSAVEERAKAAGLDAMTLRAGEPELRAVVSFDVEKHFAVF